jgi:Uma2 family endonuclease
MIELPRYSEGRPWVVHLASIGRMTAAQFWKVCRENPDWRFELSAEGDLAIMPPSGGESGARSGRVTAQLIRWADLDGSGVVFDSSTGFELPDGAIRSPDAAWVARAQLAQLTRSQKQKFIPLAPDFVVEIKSPTDSMRVLQAKMREYIANGTRLGWLIDPQERTVYVFRPHTAVRRINSPATLSGDPVLAGFTLDLRRIWEPNV